MLGHRILYAYSNRVILYVKVKSCFNGHGGPAGSTFQASHWQFALNITKGILAKVSWLSASEMRDIHINLVKALAREDLTEAALFLSLDSRIFWTAGIGFGGF